MLSFQSKMQDSLVLGALSICSHVPVCQLSFSFFSKVLHNFSIFAFEMISLVCVPTIYRAS